MAGVSFLILAHLVAWPLYSQPVCGSVEAAGKYILKFVTHGLRLFNGYMVFPRMDMPYVNYPQWMLGSFLTYINTAINITIHTSPSALLNISLGYHPRGITSGSRDFGF